MLPMKGDTVEAEEVFQVRDSRDSRSVATLRVAYPRNFGAALKRFSLFPIYIYHILYILFRLYIYIYIFYKNT